VVPKDLQPSVHEGPSDPPSNQVSHSTGLEPRTQTRLIAIYKQGVRDDLNAAEKKGPHDQHLFVLSTGVQRNLRHITIWRGNKNNVNGQRHIQKGGLERLAN
jgi:hypothetical protein